jgi:hypothetical protein
MEVKIQIESGQIGDTVIDLFKNLKPEKKEELALSILKEWLQNPEFFETKNKEQLVIEEFRKGIRKPRYSYKNFDENTPEYEIKNNSDFQDAINNYKTSKQILVEDIKNEIIKYYKEYLTKELKENESINKIKEETFKEIAQMFPTIIAQTLINVFSTNLLNMQNTIQETAIRTYTNMAMTENIMQKLR